MPGRVPEWDEEAMEAGPTARDSEIRGPIAGGACSRFAIDGNPGILDRPVARNRRDRSRRIIGDPYGTRTRVFAVRGRRPGPLDEGANGLRGGHMWARQRLVNQRALTAR